MSFLLLLLRFVVGPLAWFLSVLIWIYGSYTQSTGLLGRGSSCRKTSTYTGQNKQRRINGRHPRLEKESIPRSQRLSGRRHFMVGTARPLRSIHSRTWINATVAARDWNCQRLALTFKPTFQLYKQTIKRSVVVIGLGISSWGSLEQEFKVFMQ